MTNKAVKKIPLVDISVDPLRLIHPTFLKLQAVKVKSHIADCEEYKTKFNDFEEPINTINNLLDDEQGS